MKRNILLLGCLVLLSGCTVNYNVEVKNDKIYETIEGKVTEEEAKPSIEGRTDVNPIYYNLYEVQSPLINNDDAKYDKTITPNGEYQDFTFNYVYDYNYNKSRIINKCFEMKLVEEDENSLYVKLAGHFGCLYSDKVTINVKSNYAVTEHNADKVKDGVYTWVIDKDNKNDVDIMMSILKNVDYQDTSKKKIFNAPTYRIVALVLFIILAAGAYFLYKKREN